MCLVCLRASRLPMRNWNTLDTTGPSSPSIASRLPMRNWNQFPLVLMLLRFRFQTTYEELKLLLWNQFQISKIPASRLPMRNWNAGILEISSCFQLPDYLWGIETLVAVDGLRNTPRFQTTYEELKLNVPQIIPRITSRFQTTYEELKLGTWQDLLLHRLLASRLPMRNWNIASGQ